MEIPLENSLVISPEVLLIPPAAPLGSPSLISMEIIPGIPMRVSPENFLDVTAEAPYVSSQINFGITSEDPLETPGVHRLPQSNNPEVRKFLTDSSRFLGKSAMIISPEAFLVLNSPEIPEK